MLRGEDPTIPGDEPTTSAKDPTMILHALPAEPEGYRGIRRRFWLTNKGGGVALPALLVAGSIVVVLIVVGVAQILPRDAAGQLPNGSRNGAVTGDGGQAAGDPGSSGGTRGSARPSRSASGRPGASPSGGVLAGPGQSALPQPVPTTPGGPTAPPAGRQPVAVEAEAASLGGAAKSSACGTCSSGAKVRSIGNNNGYVTFTVANVPAAGSYQMAVTYELGSPSRVAYVSVNGGAPTQFTFTSNTTDWYTQLNATVPVSLAAGTNTIKFFNPTSGWAPDLDKISV
jgi:hypothetical protein